MQNSPNECDAGEKNVLLYDIEGWLENLTSKQANNITQY